MLRFNGAEPPTVGAGDEKETVLLPGEETKGSSFLEVPTLGLGLKYGFCTIAYASWRAL